MAEKYICKTERALRELKIYRKSIRLSLEEINELNHTNEEVLVDVEQNVNYIFNSEAIIQMASQLRENAENLGQSVNEISEVINLRVKDVNLEELTIHLKNSKGKKDRITVFPEKIKNDLKILIANKSPDEIVFLSERGGELSERIFQKILPRIYPC